jgi:hypothetical protein
MSCVGTMIGPAKAMPASRTVDTIVPPIHTYATCDHLQCGCRGLAPLSTGNLGSYLWPVACGSGSAAHATQPAASAKAA